MHTTRSIDWFGSANRVHRQSRQETPENVKTGNGKYLVHALLDQPPGFRQYSGHPDRGARYCTDAPE
jgi:hypothetical protein